jgi:3-hydroxyisobutyrate dehydrogenase
MIKAGFIGLGCMGEPMARNVAKAGFLVGVWNRTRERAERLAQQLGVECAESPAQLAERADLVLTCVSADRDVLSVMQALLPGLRQGSLIVDVSTISSDTARQAAEQIRQKGADFIDAPVSGGVEGARRGTLAMMVGGRVSALEKARPALEAMAGRIVHIGDVGAGQAAKAINQVMCAGINEAVTEALAFGAQLGLDMPKAIDIIAGGAAGNWFLEQRGMTMLKGSFEPGFKLALHHKDLNICLEMAARLGMRLPLAEAAFRDYAELIRQGYGDKDISALFRLKYPA